MKRLSLLVLSAALMSMVLAACGAPHMKKIRSAKNTLVGREATLLARCIGDPLDIRDVPGTAGQIYVYSSAQVRSPAGALQATPRPSDAASARACVFEIKVHDGRIIAVDSDNRSGWGFGSIKNCSAVVRRCVGG